MPSCHHHHHHWLLLTELTAARLAPAVAESAACSLFGSTSCSLSGAPSRRRRTTAPTRLGASTPRPRQRCPIHFPMQQVDIPEERTFERIMSRPSTNPLRKTRRGQRSYIWRPHLPLPMQRQIQRPNTWLHHLPAPAQHQLHRSSMWHPSPAVTYLALDPVIEHVAPSPAGTCAAPAPVIENVAPSPAAAYAAPTPVSECVYRG